MTDLIERLRYGCLTKSVGSGHWDVEPDKTNALMAEAAIIYLTSPRRLIGWRHKGSRHVDQHHRPDLSQRGRRAAPL